MTIKAELKNETGILSGEVRLSYCHLLAPWVSDADKAAGKAPKYSTAICIPKSEVEQLKVIKTAIDNAVQKGIAKYGSTWKASKKPLRDGDEKDEDGEFKYTDTDPRRGCYFFNASDSKPVAIMDRAMRPLTSEDDVYSGMYARVLVNFYAFKGQQNGIAAGLNGVQKVRDGERIGGVGMNAFEEFAPLEESVGTDAGYDPLA